MIGKKIKQLRNKFYRFNIDGYIIPKNDEFFSEYSAINRLKIISNFDGTAGLAIVLRKKIICLLMEDIQSKHNNNLAKNSK